MLYSVGSINADVFFSVPHIVQGGETISSTRSWRAAGSIGGKGANQSVAAAMAGMSVKHAGLIGTDGDWLKSLIQSYGVDVSLIHLVEDDKVATGQAMIQLSESDKENAIVLNGGANLAIKAADIDTWLDKAGKTDILLLQNEISSNAIALERATSLGMTTVVNPAPCNSAILSLPLHSVDILILNEVEGQQFVAFGDASAPLQHGLPLLAQVVTILQKQQQDAVQSTRLVVLTLGGEGACCAVRDAKNTWLRLHLPVWPGAKVVDTTGAGDCFIGYLLAGLFAEDRVDRYATSHVETALKQAIVASGLAVSRMGAMDAIPKREEVLSLSTLLESAQPFTVTWHPLF